MLMDFMRRNTKNFLIAIIVLIVPAFILWGAFPSTSQKGSNTILKVGDKKVSLEEFQNYYQRLREITRMNLGSSYSPDLEKLLNLKQQALDSIIREILLKKEIERLDIAVSDEEVSDSIKKNPAFYTDGEFDAAKWNLALNNPRVSWPALIEQERESLQTQKLMEMVYSGAKVTDEEIREEYRRQNEKVKIEYVTFKASDFLDKAEVSPDDVAAYYEQQKNEYVEPAQVRLEYVELKKKPSPMDFADVEHYANSKLERAREGADFAELAEKYSDDAATKSRGGDLGFFGKGPVTRGYEEAAFSLQPGEISDLIKTPDGFYIIKVEETKGEGADKQVRARAIFFKVEPTDDTLLSLQEQATNLAYEAQSSSLSQAAQQMKLDVSTTPLFAENSRVIPDIGPVKEIAEILPGLREGAVSDVIETPSAFYVLQAAERQPERIPDLAEVKDRVEAAAKEEKALGLAKAKAEEAVKEANEKGLALGKVAGIPEVQETEPFTRRGYPPELPRLAGLVDAAFELPEAKAAGPFTNANVACVIQLKERIEAAPAGFEARKESIKNKILAQRRQEVFEEYFENLKKGIEIDINQDLFQAV